jgi:hypothetical protein
LAPNQHSELLLKVFSEDTLNLLHHSLSNQMKNNNKETSGIDEEDEEILVKISRIVNAVVNNQMTRSDAELELLTLAKGKSYYLSRAIRGINNA